MTSKPPLVEMASRILRRSLKHLSPEDTLDDHLRSEKCMATAKLASIFGCSTHTINRLRAEGMPAHKIRGQWKYFGPEVANWQLRRDTDQSARTTVTTSRPSTETKERRSA